MANITSSNAFVTQPVNDLVYILLDDEDTFNAIPLDEDRVVSVGNGRLVRFKSGQMNDFNVIFQFWPQRKESSQQ